MVLLPMVIAKCDSPIEHQKKAAATGIRSINPDVNVSLFLNTYVWTNASTLQGGFMSKPVAAKCRLQYPRYEGRVLDQMTLSTTSVPSLSTDTS